LVENAAVQLPIAATALLKKKKTPPILKQNYITSITAKI